MARALRDITSQIRRRPFRVSVLATLIAISGAVAASYAPSAAAHTPAAHAARTLNGIATAKLHLIRAEGSQLIEEGPVTGALAGSAQAHLKTGAVFTASFTIHTREGSITGHGRATPHGSGRYQSFSGSFLATDGSGRYTHIGGHAGLYGVFDRRTDSVTIQTSGTLTY